MPTYGADKERDMLRSVLPSTRRKGARDDFAYTKRNARREARQRCHELAVDPEIWDDQYDSHDYPDARIHEIKWERRGYDNVAALQRWAPHKVADVRREDRLSKLKALLPDNTIGRHAVTHVDHLPEFYIPQDHLPRRYYDQRGFWSYVDPDSWWGRAVRYAEIEARLIAAIRDHHRQLNRLLKKPVPVWKRIRGTDGTYYGVRQPDEPGRPVYGVHDITGCIAHYASRDDLRRKLLGALDAVENKA